MMLRHFLFLLLLVAVCGRSTWALPPGVTLKAIDGGPGYYCSHGFTYACAAGWDDPAYFPIMLWLAPMQSQADATRWLDLGLTGAWSITANSTLSLLTTNGLHGIVQANEMTEILAGNGGALPASVVGLLAADEPVTYQDATQWLTTTPNTLQNNRFWAIGFFWTQIYYGDVEGHLMADLLDDLLVTPNATTRHLDIVGHDIYWCAGNGNTGAFCGECIYDLGALMTQDQMRRPSHYGDMVDRMRPWQLGHYEAPMTFIIENGGPYTENTTAASYIQPPEYNAAAWSGIMHGARALLIFNHSFGGPGNSFDNFASSYYSTIQAGQTISIYNQAKATHAAIKSLAPVINSPFALGYASVSPAGWAFGQTSTSLTGFDVMTKYYDATHSYYVFALPRYSQSLTNQTATFTVAQGTLATVVGEARTIPIVGGVFSDTFATGTTVHIYQIVGETPTNQAPARGIMVR